MAHHHRFEHAVEEGDHVVPAQLQEGGAEDAAATDQAQGKRLVVFVIAGTSIFLTARRGVDLDCSFEFGFHPHLWFSKIYIQFFFNFILV